MNRRKNLFCNHDELHLIGHTRQPLRARFGAMPSAHMLSRILLCIILACSLCAYASAKTNPPVLVSESNSTRAIALESVTLTPEPFALDQPYALVQDQRTRVMIFALNLTLQPGENFSSVTADAEDASHKHYDFTVEYVGRVPEEEWLSTVILRLSDDLTDVGDVLVRLSYNGASSNRVRIGIGHTGGGLSDDVGATPTPAPPYTIKGRVTESGTGMGGVLLTLSGAQNNQATTDDNGSYSFTVTEAGDYTVTPSKNFYNFTSQSLVFNNLSNHQTGANFNAARQTFTVNGQVTDDNLHGLDGIVVALTDVTNGITTSATTNGGGSFSFANVVAGYNYTVAPATTNIFTFATQSINPLSSNLMLNIKGARRTYNISGQVVDDNSGALDGIVVALTNITNGTTTTASTGNGGNFSFANMTAGYDYTGTPTTTNIFAFTSQNISALSGNLTQSFKGARRAYTIGGQITGDAKGIGGVVVNLSGAQTATTTSDSSGNYSIAGVRAGLSYTITPSQTSFYKFTRQEIDSLSGNQAINFASRRFVLLPS